MGNGRFGKRLKIMTKELNRMEKSYGTKSSNETIVPYTNKRKPKDDRSKRAKALITRKPGGGDIA